MKGIQIIIECSLKIMISLYHYSSRKMAPPSLSLSTYRFPSLGIGFFFISWRLSLPIQFPPLRSASLLFAISPALPSRSMLLHIHARQLCSSSMVSGRAGRHRLGQSFQEVWVNIYVTGPSRGLVPYIYDPSSKG